MRSSISSFFIAAIAFSGLVFSEEINVERDFKLMISEADIQAKIEKFAKEIDREYQGKELVIVPIMNGAICFAADLMRALSVPCELMAIRASSYGTGFKSGELIITGLEKMSIENKDVLLIDDIFDTGNTLKKVSAALLKKNPASLKGMVLLVKNVPHVPDIFPDYYLFQIEDKFVLGYGLDYLEKYRGLRGIFYKE